MIDEGRVFKDSDFKILREGFRSVSLNYSERTYRFSNDIEDLIESKREELLKKHTDGYLARVDPNKIFVKSGELELDLMHTSYIPFVVTRNNVENLDDNAYPLGVGGVTVSTKDGKFFQWFGVKSKRNELGAGEVHVIPSGYLDPSKDKDNIDALFRELHEELLGYTVSDGKKSLKCMMKLRSRVVDVYPFALVDRVSLGNPVLVHLVVLSMTKEEVEQAYKLIPEEEREFSKIGAVDVKKLDYFLEKYHDRLRPHARGVIRATIDAKLFG